MSLGYFKDVCRFLWLKLEFGCKIAFTTAGKSRMISFFRKLYHDPFKRYLVISLVILGIVLLFTGQKAVEQTTDEGLEVHFFYLSGCKGCDEQKPFNEKLASTYPSIYFVYHDISEAGESTLLFEMLASLGLENEQLDVPTTIFGGQAFVGWDSEETTGKEIEETLQQCLAGNCPEIGSDKPKDEVTLPIIGKIKTSNYSLPSLAVVLGFVDGFNPCALWVLVYLISLVLTLKDKRKIWLLVGSFVFASGALYFLFMTAWLNAFLLIGYFRPVTILVGLVALGGGILNTKEFIETKGAIVCEVGDAESRKKTMTRIEKIVSSPLTLGTIAGVVVLAFVVNSIEFVCSSALPAIFTRVLSLNNLSTFEYYGYILLYDFFFMLVTLLIFGSAAFATTSRFGDRCAKYCRPLGGVVLLILGVMLLFIPQFLP